MIQERSGPGGQGRIGTGTGSAAPLTYRRYLRLGELLDLQHPVTDQPDEMQFVIAHQAIELWLKLIVNDLRRTARLIDRDRWFEAITVLHRINRSSVLVLEQTRSLFDLPVTSFCRFRTNLDTASGAQSVQFRELEILSGLRDESYLRDLYRFTDPDLHRHFTALLAERDVARAHQASAGRFGVRDWAAFYRQSATTSPLYLLNEQLIDYDETWLRWRTEHLLLVDRMLGTGVRGTGGSDPGHFLARTRSYRFFPYLWDCRSQLAVEAGGEAVR